MQKRRSNKRAARKSAARCYRGPGWCSRSKRLALYMRDSFTCAYCGRDLRNCTPEQMGLDHLVCHAHGGSNDPSNLVTACAACNRARSTKPWREYATGGAIERIESLIKQPLNWALARAITQGALRTEWADRLALHADTAE